MNKKDEAFFKVAKAVSESSDFPRFHVGCCVVDGHRIISSGTNSIKSHPLQKKLNMERFTEDSTPHCLHAETTALIPIMNRKDIDWNKIKIYIYREHKNGTKAMSRPCASCQKLLRDLGIKKVFYTTNNGFAEELFD